MIIISNIAVFLGALAMLLITGRPKYQRVGLWLGLLVQPAWFYLTITNRDWGMLGGTVLYTIAMINGLIKR